MYRLRCFFVVRFLIGACLSLSVSATVVRFDIEFGGTPHGSMYIDIFDYSDEPPLVPAPVTVANFLNYVDDNYSLAKTFRGTLGDGNILVFSSNAQD